MGTMPFGQLKNDDKSPGALAKAATSANKPQDDITSIKLNLDALG